MEGDGRVVGSRQSKLILQDEAKLSVVETTVFEEPTDQTSKPPGKSK
jgi:hypothetical protein